MKKRHGLLCMVAVAVLATALWAGRPAAADDLYRESAEVDSMMGKLGRGCANILTGWFEIPRQIGISVGRHDPFTGVVVGSVKGVGWTYLRTVTGVYEVLTFAFPTPADYGAFLEPEFILDDMWGARMPIISDPPVYPSESRTR